MVSHSGFSFLFGIGACGLEWTVNPQIEPLRLSGFVRDEVNQSVPMQGLSLMGRGELPETAHATFDSCSVQRTQGNIRH